MAAIYSNSITRIERGTQGIFCRNETKDILCKHGTKGIFCKLETQGIFCNTYSANMGVGTQGIFCKTLLYYIIGYVSPFFLFLVVKLFPYVLHVLRNRGCKYLFTFDILQYEKNHVSYIIRDSQSIESFHCGFLYKAFVDVFSNIPLTFRPTSRASLIR